MCRRFPSVFISSISSFLSQLPLSGNKAAFSFQSCPSIVGSGVRIQWSCRCPLPPHLAPPILSTQSQSFFSVPEFSSGFSSAFRPARLSSVVGFVRLLVRTVFSLVLCHDAVFGWSRRPSFPPSSSSPQHNYFPYPASDCTLSSFFTTFPTASRVSSQEN